MEENTKRTVAIIAAIGSSIKDPRIHGIYSAEGKLPWPKLAKDLAFFKEKTLGHITIMGRETWDSIPEGVKPLPNRVTIVISSSLPEGKNFWGNQSEKSFFVCRSVEQAIACAKLEKPNANIFFIGGKQLWQEAIPHCTALFVTHVYGDFNGELTNVKTFTQLLEPETHFSKYDFRLVEAKSIVDENYKLTFTEHRVGHPVYVQ